MQSDVTANSRLQGDGEQGEQGADTEQDSARTETAAHSGAGALFAAVSAAAAEAAGSESGLARRPRNVPGNPTPRTTAEKKKKKKKALKTYVTFRLKFHHFDRLELDLRGHMHVRGAAFSCLRLKVADGVLI